MTATGEYNITRWDEYTERSSEGPKLAKVGTSSTYTGEIEGTATSETVMIYTSDDVAHYTGYERFTGSIEGRTGTVIFQVTGTFENGTATTSLTIVPGSGTAELKGLTGTGDYVAVQGEPSLKVTLDHTFA